MRQEKPTAFDLITAIQRLRAYLVLLFASRARADDVLGHFLTEMLSKPPVLKMGDLLVALHDWMARNYSAPTARAPDATEQQRMLNWYLDGFSPGERAVALMRAVDLAPLTDISRALGITEDEADGVVADFVRRVTATKAIVVCAQPFVAGDMVAAIQGLGIDRVHQVGSMAALRQTLRAGTPSIVVADTDALPTEALADTFRLDGPGTECPTVLVTASLSAMRPFRWVVGKPFSPVALRRAVLSALGA